jgi:endoglucanase
VDRIELIRELSEALGAPGDERPVAELLKKRLAGKASQSSDRLGSTIFTKEGSTPLPRIMVAAHMDEIAFMVKSITKEGFLRFQSVGHWAPQTVLGHRVVVKSSQGFVEGVIGAPPPHWRKAMDREKEMLPLEDMLIDVGAPDKEAVEALGISVGDFAFASPGFVELSGGRRLMGKAFDDRVGCALLVELVEALQGLEHPNTVAAAATVQEEVGLRGARTAAQTLEPDLAVVLEGPPADDLPGMAKDAPQGALGAGVQIRCFDPTMVVHGPLKEFVISAAREEGIPFQLVVRDSGGTDAGSIHLTGTGVPSIVLGVPVRYIHSHHSVLDLADYEATLRLLTALVVRLDEAAVAGLQP